MQRKKIRLGIVGTGNIFHKHLPGILANLEKFEIVGIANHDKEVDAEFPKDWNVKTFYDHQEMFSSLREKIDCVVVLTQSEYHYQVTKAAVEHGYDVLVEKPFSEDTTKIQEINKLAKKKGTRVYIVLQCRYMSLYKAAQEVLDKELLGEIRSVDFSQIWQRPVGYMSEKKALRPLFEYTIHYLDLITQLFATPEVLYTKSYKYKHMECPHSDTIRSVIEYDSNISGFIHFSLAGEPRNLSTELTILGSNGFLILDFLNNELHAEFLDEESNKIFKKLKSKIKEDKLFEQLYKDLFSDKAPTLESSVDVTNFITQIYAKE